MYRCNKCGCSFVTPAFEKHYPISDCYDYELYAVCEQCGSEDFEEEKGEENEQDDLCV